MAGDADPIAFDNDVGVGATGNAEETNPLIQIKD